MYLCAVTWENEEYCIYHFASFATDVENLAKRTTEAWINMARQRQGIIKGSHTERSNFIWQSEFSVLCNWPGKCCDKADIKFN